MDEESKIKLVGIANDPNTDEAVKELKRLNGLGFQLFECSESMRNYYVVPFVEDESLMTYFGIKSIKRFVDKRLAAGH